MKGYRRYKGWDGTVWHIKMTEKEVDFWENVKLVIGVLLFAPLFSIFFALLFGAKFF